MSIAPPFAPVPLPAAHDDARLMVLRELEQDPHISQRLLAKRLGVSLGKAHYLLQALLAKGLIKVRNFEQSGQKLAYSYLLTPTGLREKAQMTREFLARKEAEFESLRLMIDQLHAELATPQVEDAAARNALADRQTFDSIKP
ncbi:MarR family EPS-associated transcriptional regulator [Paucibacter sp. R3-3]|uniref:MarR family EPS-associated transcriptional regulator n=1 Tax=Roseateles agri TaxID=3098619 RepID=A0ABU5DET3_9BURK|nr:MarR family EPS-associated transcriptional regulator [Paucibacter sp. R3-3]MDY0744255.1 MarR family EPS-associated transcriptional regulator [Paucibacter sp. R3-3]